MKIRVSKTVWIETDGMTFEELVEAKDYMEERANQMNTEIKAAILRGKETGLYPEQDWFRRIRASLFNTNQAIEKLKPVISKLYHERVRVHNKKVADYFLEVCRERMAAAEFSDFYDDAQRRKDAEFEALML